MDAWQDRIAVNPNVMGGKPVIKGTRVPVAVILACLAGGDEIATVCDQFLITEEDVRSALAFASTMANERMHALPA